MIEKQYYFVMRTNITFKGGVEYIVRAQNMRINTPLISVGQMKRLINTSKRYVLMVVREKDVRTSDSFQGCDPPHKEELIDIVSKYDDIFQELDGLPPKREIQHEIHLQHDYSLPNVGMYRMSIVEMTEIKKQVQGLLDQGVTRPNSSPCGSPIVMVPKKYGTWRMCVDYRALNKITVKNQYPLPHIDDLLDQLKNDVYFTKLDLRSGYHRIRVVEQDEWKTVESSTLPNLQQPFEIETNANGYAMGAILMQYCKPIYYHSETFNQVVVNYPTYDKELCALVQSVKK
jgi:hypothetical protein